MRQFGQINMIALITIKRYHSEDFEGATCVMRKFPGGNVSL
jgi:hypothetical protein